MTAHSTYVIKVSILTEGGGGVKKGQLNLENENNQLMNLLSLMKRGTTICLPHLTGKITFWSENDS